MVVSRETIIEISRTLLVYLGYEISLKLVRKLKEIEGNKSFRETICKVYEYLQDQVKKMQI